MKMPETAGLCLKPTLISNKWRRLMESKSKGECPQITLNHELAREFVGGYRLSYQFRTMLEENESSVGRAVD
jgi:hypothetical protein